MQINYLSGAKGGGGGSAPPPTKTPDNLRSKDTVEVVLAIGEGPMFGLPRGAKDFKVGDTQLQNDSGEFNFKSFILNWFPGNPSPSPIIPVLGGQGGNAAVNVPLETNISVTRQTTIPNIDSIDVRIAVARLLESKDTGTFNATAKFKIEYKLTTSPTWNLLYGSVITISGKTTSNYIKEFTIVVPRTTTNWDVRVTKISPANTEEYYCDLTWESYQETISTAKYYPNTACIHLVGEASDQFSSIPSWSGLYRGLIMKVPTNYDPITRVYSGIWDGSWKLAWCNNPAWCLYDFVMNDRYGMRSYYPDVNLDKYDVYDAAKWCDEPVPNGMGGFQPRYTFNAYISEPREGKELARYIAGSFNATFFDDLNGKAFLRVDKDDPAAFIFGEENTLEGGFEYTYTDITSRYNDITVTFLNPALNWQEDRRRVFDQAKIDKHGRIPYDFIAVGCTNEREARRKAWYKLITSNTETCIVTFSTNRLGGFVNPFDVILISDPDMGYGITGRFKSVSSDRFSVTLRDPIYLEVGVPYDLTVMLDDGSKYKINIIDIEPGYNTELNFGTALPENLADRAFFTLESPGVIGLPRPFRVTKVEEKDGSPDNFMIEAIAINRNKWYDTDNITDTGVIDYSALPSPFDPPGPTAVGFEERFIKERREFHITISPVFNRGSYKYYANDHSFEVWSRLKDTDDLFVKREVMFGDTLINHPPGLYEFKILGKSYLGYTSRLETAAIYVFNVTNPKDAPAPVDWVKINKREVYWGYQNPPDDFAGFVVRYHNQAGRITWDDAAQPHQGLLSATTMYTQLIPASARVIMVRAVDYFGIVSEESGIIYRDEGDILATNIIEQFDYHPTWPGTIVAGAVDPTDDELKADDTGGLMYSGTPTALMYDGGGMYEATYAAMEYYGTFTNLSEGELIVQIDFDGSGYELAIREVGELVWQPVSERQNTLPGTYEFRLSVFGGPVRGIIRTFSVIIDAVDVEEDIQDIAVSSAGIRLPLTKEFGTIRIVSVIIQDDGGAGTAVGYRVIDKDPILGPMIRLVDASGAWASGLVDAVVKGFK